MNKVCNTCKEDKPIEEYFKNRNTRYAYCKKCYYKKHAAFNVKNSQRWQKENPDKFREIVNRASRKRYANDEVFRSMKLMRWMLWRCLNGKRKNDRTETLLGYTAADFWREFQDDISVFKMYGIKHNIDHKIPFEWFEKNTPPSIINSLENLQIISEQENNRKGNEYASPVKQEFFHKAIEWVKTEYQSQVVLV